MRAALGIGVLVLTLGSLVGYHYLKQHVAVDGRIHPSDVIRLRRGALNCGQVWATTDFRWQIPVENVGERTISLRGLRAGCGCASVDVDSLDLEPRESRIISLTIDLSAAPALEEFENGVFLTALNLMGMVWIDDKPHGTFQWSLKGKVRRPVKLEAKQFVIPDELVCGGPRDEYQVHGRCLFPMRKLEVTCEPPIADVNVYRSSNEPETFAIHIVPKSELQPGVLDANILLRSFPANASAEPVLTILPVIGRVSRDVSIYPRSIACGGLDVGDRETREFRVESKLGKVVEIASVTCPSPQVSVTEKHAGARATDIVCCLHVHAQCAGSQCAKVTVQVKRSGTDKNIVMELPVRWHGIDMEN